MKRFLSVVLAIALILACAPAIPLTANAETSGSYTYTVSNGKATITDCSTSISGDITIPATLGGYPVTSIGSSAFSGCSSLTSVVIPDSVTRIRDSAFSYCSSLTSVVIPDSVTIIGSSAFRNCSSLTGIWVDADNTAYCSDEQGVLYNKNKTTLIQAPAKGITGTYTIPDRVTIIGSYAFSSCNSLTSVVIPDRVTSIGSGAFSSCSSLTSVVIGDSVISIGSYAFEDCSSLTSVVIGDSVTGIDSSAFWNCSNLTGICVDADNTAYCSDEQGVLYNKNKTTLIKAPTKGITGTYSIPDSVTYIEDYAFIGCSSSSLTSVVIGDSVTSIGNYAFYNCSSLTSVVIPDSVTSIGDWAFSYCSNLTSVVIPDSVTSIGSGAFYNCSSLTSVVIGDSVTSIGSSAFSGCSSLTSVVIGDSVTSIGSSAFSSCSSLTSVVIGDSVTSIGYAAFSGCSSLTSVVIGDSVTSIGSYAFRDCSSLTSVVIGDSVTSIGSYAFSSCSSLTSVVIPDSVTSIGDWAFSYCSNLTSVVIPDSVTSIGNYAFRYCNSLSHVAYTGTQSQWNRISIGSDNSDLTAATRHYEISFEMIDNCVEAGLYCPVCKEFITHTVKEGGAHSYADIHDLSCDTCNYNRTITGISLSKLPEKLRYLQFEELDTTGGEVLVTLNDGSTGVISLTEEMVTGFDSATVGTKTVTVTYEGFTTTFTVTVDEPMVCEYLEIGKDTATQYKTVEEALTVATSGTIKLLADVTVDTAVLKPGVTLDLNGYTLTAELLVAMDGAQVTDGGEGCVGGGSLKIAKGNLALAKDNDGVIPVWNGDDGYVFTKVAFQEMAKSVGESAAQYIFLPAFSNVEVAAWMADGSLDNSMNIKVCMSWNNGQSCQYYTYGDDLVQKVFDGTGKWMFSLNVTGISGITDMTAQAVVVTDSGAQATATGTTLVAG